MLSGLERIKEEHRRLDEKQKKDDKVKEALKGKRKRTQAKEESAMSKLLVDDFFEMKPLKLPGDVWKDQKKLSRFLGDL